MAYDINDEQLEFSVKFGSVKIALMRPEKELLRQADPNVSSEDEYKFTLLLNDYEHEDNTQSHSLTHEELAVLATLLRGAANV